MSDDSKLSDAINAIREWHYAEVRSIADSLIKECNEEHAKEPDHDTRREWMTERVDEDTDSHNHVIYTFKAKALLLASDNEDAYEEELGEKPQTVEAAACMALRRDVWDLLSAREDEWLPEEIDEE